MEDKILILLSSAETDYSTVKTFTVLEAVQKIMQLFN